MDLKQLYKYNAALRLTLISEVINVNWTLVKFYALTIQKVDL